MTVALAPSKLPDYTGKRIVNNFSINVATANGTGSQTSNMTLLRALFKMGIPVNGKNLFPSNIQGQPTWFHIRVSHEGYVSRLDEHAILVAFNSATMLRDIAEMPSGSVCFVPEHQKGVPDRDDMIFYRVPVLKLMKGSDAKGKLKDYLSNMVYVGALSYMLGIPLEYIDRALMHHFNNRRKLVDSNMAIINESYTWASENMEKVDPYFVEPMNETEGKMLITGNEAAALGSLFGGVQVVAWYPITPSTSVVDAVNDYKNELRDEDSIAVIQAEDELAAIGMVLGAGWAGARAMTATSGPGVSLMAEFAGLAYFAEIPSVIWDIQRVGPSTGLPTRSCQGDVTFAYYLGHGDTKNVILLPKDPAECFEFGTTSLNLAEELQTLVLVLSDLDIGMNYWMSEPFAYPTEPIKRGKVLDADGIAELKGTWGRYKDVDGDGIPYRTLPGNEHPLGAYFARGTGHDANAKYSERPDDWVENTARLGRKFESARKMVPAPVIEHNDKADIGIIYYGSTWCAVEEGQDRLREAGIETATMRIRALPLSAEVKTFVEKYDRCYVVEMNRDAQMHGILRSEMPEQVMKLRSIAHLDGQPFTGSFVKNSVLEGEQA